MKGNYYDVKSHFLAAVPLAMFLAWAFKDVMWRPRELGACLIVDDPLLKPKYGRCDFVHLRDLMQTHGFTTNVAFIPWNWWRTTRSASRLFREHSEHLSVSIHGCDHTAAEFGDVNSKGLFARSETAQKRMARHASRTGIAHEPVMVFPQGVFSSVCPAVLKSTGFLAAVNTEVAPTDVDSRTTVRDVWDVAIRSYGAFAIYTRRYAFHGIENFAFDMLLGKPCFIVAHHDFFAGGAFRAVELVQQLSRRGASLQWRSPREVIRRACRRRRTSEGVEQIEMYGTELYLWNDGTGELPAQVRYREPTPQDVADVSIRGEGVQWRHHNGDVVVETSLTAGEQTLCRVGFKRPHESLSQLNLGKSLAVAPRRFLSELRDEYVQRTR